MQKNNSIMLVCLLLFSPYLSAMEELPVVARAQQLINAIEADNPEIVDDKVLQGPGLDFTFNKPNDICPLIYAVRCGSSKMTAWLLDNGAKRDVTTREGFGAMCVAGAKNQVQVLETLLQKGFDIDAQTNGASPLRLSIANDAADAALFLLQQGAKPGPFVLQSNTTKMSLPLLHLAVFSGAYKVTAKLIEECKCDVNGKVFAPGKLPIYFTPNDLAVMGTHWRIAQLLKEKGADATSHYQHMHNLIAK